MVDELLSSGPTAGMALIGEDDDDFPQVRDKVGRIDGGPTDNPMPRSRNFRRWHGTYHKPGRANVEISGDRDPDSGWSFDPHPSTGQ